MNFLHFFPLFSIFLLLLILFLFPVEFLKRNKEHWNVISSAVFCVDTEILARNNAALNIQECAPVFNMNWDSGETF